MGSYQDVSTGSVPVLLQEAPGVVEDHPGKVVDSEGCAGVGPRLQIVLILAVLLVEPLHQAHVSCLGKLGLLVNEGKDVHGFLSDHVERGLIVDESYFLPTNSLLGVLILFHFEDVFYKELLEVLVCIIDTELFERVIFKVLKTENVQNSNCTLVSTYFSFENCFVDFLNGSMLEDS